MFIKLLLALATVVGLLIDFMMWVLPITTGILFRCILGIVRILDAIVVGIFSIISELKYGS